MEIVTILYNSKTGEPIAVLAGYSDEEVAEYVAAASGRLEEHGDLYTCRVPLLKRRA
jgi:hypothetical protein